MDALVCLFFLCALFIPNLAEKYFVHHLKGDLLGIICVPKYPLIKTLLTATSRGSLVKLYTMHHSLFFPCMFYFLVSFLVTMRHSQVLSLK